MFKKKQPKVIDVNGQKIELQPRPSKWQGILSSKGRPAPSPITRPQTVASTKYVAPQQVPQAGKAASRWRLYIEGVGARHPGLEIAIIERGINQSLYSFIQRMAFSALMISIGIGLTLAILLVNLGLNIIIAVALSLAIMFATFRIAFNTFLGFPTHIAKRATRNIDRNILFAARDIIISLRSGMPLFNALVAVSSGYGDTSKQFAAIIEKVQLGMPLEEAIDQTTAASKSDPFKRIMLQASISIKAGADIVNALQGVVEQITTERIIDLRRYGQRLNAISMFYMLFGVILPTMGIAIITILTTFIAIITVTPTLLYLSLVAIFFLQVIFLMLITSSRPAFAL